MLVNVTKGQVIAQEVRQATTFWQRLKGLLGTDWLPAGEALLIRPCNSVHTVGMNYPIDVVFLDDMFQVVKIAEHLHPGRLAISKVSSIVVELSAGAAARGRIDIGDRLALET